MKSLLEIERHWTIEDLLDANIALDAWEDAEHRAYEKARADAQKRRP